MRRRVYFLIKRYLITLCARFTLKPPLRKPKPKAPAAAAAAPRIVVAVRTLPPVESRGPVPARGISAGMIGVGAAGGTGGVGCSTVGCGVDVS